MDPVLRMATMDDLEQLTRARVDFMKEIWPESAGLVENAYADTREHLCREMERGTMIGYLLFDGTELAASAAFLVYELPPQTGRGPPRDRTCPQFLYL